MDTKETEVFWKVYTDFDKWLQKLGFKEITKCKTSLDYNYSFYNKHINSLCGVEHYSNELLNFSIRLLRDKNEHKFMLVGELGTMSDIFTIDEFKKILTQEVVRLKDAKILELSKITF